MGTKLYTIPFVGLKLGTHEFEYHIDKTFFANYEYSLIKDSDIDVELEFHKQETMLILDFYIAGTIKSLCDRCLEEFDLEIDGHNKLIVKFGDETIEESDEVMILSRGESEIDVSQYIYEYISLLLPYKVAHPEDEDGNPTCNAESLKKIDQLQHNTKKEDKDATDPRWSALKNLYKK